MIFAYDIGGTNIKFGVFDCSDHVFKCVKEGCFENNVGDGAKKMILSIAKHAEVLKKTFFLEGIALSSAGQIDSVTGNVIYASENIPGYTGLNPGKILNEIMSVPVSIENDVNCFLLGEINRLNLKGDAIALTLGTGIGAALFLNGKIYRGHKGIAGEIGHLQLVKDGLPCTCGQFGCYEQYASTKALAHCVKLKLGIEDLIDFFETCKEGDETFLKVLNEWVDSLTDGIKDCIYLINPEKIIIGGAIGKQGAYLQRKISEQLSFKLLPSFVNSCEILISKDANKSNLIGAIINYHDKIEKGL